MFYLYPKSTKIIAARDRFHAEVLTIVSNRLSKVLDEWQDENLFIDTFFSMLILEKLDEILIGEPNTLSQLNISIGSLMGKRPILKKAIEFVFNYEYFSDKDTTPYCAYDLAKDLQVNTCTYCNRNYTYTVITKAGEKVIRPEFDHYFDKAKNPLLALSFYNLIPSCLICNSRIKHTKPLNIQTHLHPYIDDSNPDFQFSYKYVVKGSKDVEVKVNAKAGSKAETTAKFFKLQEVYNAHASELGEVLKIRDYFSIHYLAMLKKNLAPGVSISDDEIYRIIFGSEYDSTKFINRPFSKFKFDILKELGII